MQTPADYVRESSIARLAAQGKKLLETHRATLDAIERQFGVQPSVLLAIWGRETAYGGYKLPHDALRVLATQAYTGRRKDMFRGEFLAALKMLQDGVPRDKMRSSWGGAMGLTQFLPSEFYKHAVDFDGDGKVDIWTSIRMRLRQRPSNSPTKGWQRGARWAYEVRVPSGADCTIAQPGHVMPIGEWLRRGYALAYGPQARSPRAEERGFAAVAGRHLWPGIPGAEELFRHQRSTTSPTFMCCSSAISATAFWTRVRSRLPWSKNTQLRSEQVEAMQRTLTARGLYGDKIDGKAGMLTRAALGAYQKANGLKLDCWPTAEVLAHMQKKQIKARRRFRVRRAGVRVVTCVLLTSRAEEPRTAPADNVAVGIADGTAGPVPAQAAVSWRCAIRIGLVAGDRVVSARIGVGRRVGNRVADDGRADEARANAEANAAAAAARVGGGRRHCGRQPAPRWPRLVISIFFIRFSKMRPARRRSQNKIVTTSSLFCYARPPICRKFDWRHQQNPAVTCSAR